jgi:hypothetical protein
MTEKELKQLLHQQFEVENWKILLPTLFRKVEFFTANHAVFQEVEKVNSGGQVGIIHLDDGKSLAIFVVEVHDSIKIVFNRKGLREIAANYIDQNIVHGALVFYHNRNQGDYRFSFIAKWSEIDMESGMLRKEETKPTRYTYLLGSNQACTTAARQLLLLASKKDSGESNIETLKEAFSLEALNKEFYLDYRRISVSIIRHIFPDQINDKLKAHQGTLNLLNRMMFVYFIQKKDWLMKNPDFLYSYWKEYKSSGAVPDSFHEKWINKVFFSAFNGKAYSDPEIFKILPAKYHQVMLEFPFLNGGLFTHNDDYDSFALPDKYFENIFDFLQRYNFTIIEDSEEEVSLEINPELLGKMYEGMINATDLDDVDAEHGIIYTERPEINFMTRRSIVEVLYKKLTGNYSREFLYHFCFDKAQEKLELLKRYNADAAELREALLSITVLDPACGSGSMLIGSIQLMMELLRCLAEYDSKPLTPKEDFEFKKKIISESIYGVDIKEWAVRIAELRFWLYMIAEAEFTTEELTKTPLLPNLDFKLRQGNSLLQQIGNLDLSFEGLFKNRKKTSGASRKLNDFIRKKKAFITNQNDSDTTYQRLKNEELFVFRTFLQELIIENQQEIKRLIKGDGQISIFGDEKKGNLFEERIAKLETENEQIQKVLQSIRDTGRLPFSFDIDFMEIFLTKDDPGFDLVLGNPPYVRQEDILPADDALELERLLKPENKTEKARINKAYKETLSDKVYKTWPFLASKVKTKVDGKDKTVPVYGSKVPGRSDLYVYFQLLCPALLNSKGTFCFIISNSWLDVEFGGFVQQFLLKHTQLHAIYDCSVRSFDASVNTIIYLHSAFTNIPALTGVDKHKLGNDKYKMVKPVDNNVHFVMNKADYAQTAYAPFLIEQEHCRENTFRRFYRLIVKSQQELWEEGFDEDERKYFSNKWGGKYLRAPEIFYRILSLGGKRIKKLNDYGTASFGVKTGANDYFIFPNKYWNIEIQSHHCRIYSKPNRLPEKSFNLPLEYLHPIIKSPKELSNTIVGDGSKYLLVIPPNPPNHDILKYIEFGELDKLPNGEDWKIDKKPTCASRKNWYSLSDIGKPDFCQGQFFNERFFISKVEGLYVDNVLNQITANNFDASLIIHSFFNSTIGALIISIHGREGLGDGALKLQVSELNRLPVFGLSKIINNTEVSDIFTEIGLSKSLPFRTQSPNPLPDRKALDDLIFDELGLSQEERNEVYWATAELVKQRLDKAGSR